MLTRKSLGRREVLIAGLKGTKQREPGNDLFVIEILEKKTGRSLR